jgi:hypothetical protein
MNSYIGPDELIYNNDIDGNIHSGGFNVNSIMMKGGFSPIITLNSSNASQIGGAENVSDLFNNLVIPNWSLSYNYKSLGGARMNHKEDLSDKENEANEANEEIITEELHEKLLNLVRASEDELKQNQKLKPKQSQTHKYTKKTKIVKTGKKGSKKNKKL